jgi:hypothetical protein
MKLRIPLMIAAVVAVPIASAADSMRCGNRVVADGDPKAKVAELCGKPTQTERRTVYRSGIPRQELSAGLYASEPVSDRELLIHDRSLVEVEVDVWLYNPGRSRLMREVVFQDGRVVAVNVLGRGY